MNKNILVILAAGIGSRFDAKLPKQYTALNGRQVIEICLQEMSQSQLTDKIILVVNDSSKIQYMKQLFVFDVIEGGDSRAASFQKAINYINDAYPLCDKVIFHEAARPLITRDIVDEYFALLDHYDYVETCKRITDSLGSYVIKAPNREDYYLIQAPEAYRFEVLKKYFDVNSPIYFAANQFPDTCNGFQFFDVKYNYKLTIPEDKIIIEAILKNRAE